MRPARLGVIIGFRNVLVCASFARAAAQKIEKVARKFEFPISQLTVKRQDREVID
jgi:hypothetical protein